MPSWYRSSVAKLIATSGSRICFEIQQAADLENWDINTEQREEWKETVRFLQRELRHPELEDISGVILEYDFRRRGLRIDCILLAPGLIFVLEFKRGDLESTDRDQVMRYCVNLIEFHGSTRRSKALVVPILVTRSLKGTVRSKPLLPHPFWKQTFTNPLETHDSGLGRLLATTLSTLRRRTAHRIDIARWDNSAFEPSSSIVDAAISLYGAHDVSAMKSHAAATTAIENCSKEVLDAIEIARRRGGRRLILVSGCPGSGKTLVGLKIAFDNRLRDSSVFATGNAPLVEVLNESLRRSYVRQYSAGKALGGFSKRDARLMINVADFKIVKAHNLLGSRGRHPVLIFDEAQRTYRQGKRVNRIPLKDDEASLIMRRMERRKGAVIVLLLGQKQHINRDECGASIWLETALRRSWKFAASDKTLSLGDFSNRPDWRTHRQRIPLRFGNLSYSMRCYRNRRVERWADAVIENSPAKARKFALKLGRDSGFFLSRSLERAKAHIRALRAGGETAGIIASGHARRLKADGLHVDEKSDIASWMLEPHGDVRSCNMLESVQNQYQIQGLELDYALLCWDADFRREVKEWACWRIHGGGWQRSNEEIEARANSYRVLLTRSRKQTIIYVPRGDRTRQDPTRNPDFYKEIADYLLRSGCIPLSNSDSS